MTPAIILDVLIAALLIAAALRGCWRGLFLSLSGILVLIAAMIGANLGVSSCFTFVLFLDDSIITNSLRGSRHLLFINKSFINKITFY